MMSPATDLEIAVWIREPGRLVLVAAGASTTRWTQSLAEARLVVVAQDAPDAYRFLFVAERADPRDPTTAVAELIGESAPLAPEGAQAMHRLLQAQLAADCFVLELGHDPHARPLHHAHYRAYIPPDPDIEARLDALLPPPPI